MLIRPVKQYFTVNGSLCLDLTMHLLNTLAPTYDHIIGKAKEVSSSRCCLVSNLQCILIQGCSSCVQHVWQQRGLIPACAATSIRKPSQEPCPAA